MVKHYCVDVGMDSLPLFRAMVFSFYYWFISYAYNHFKGNFDHYFQVVQVTDLDLSSTGTKSDYIV